MNKEDKPIYPPQRNIFPKNAYKRLTLASFGGWAIASRETEIELNYRSNNPKCLFQQLIQHVQVASRCTSSDMAKDSMQCQIYSDTAQHQNKLCRTLNQDFDFQRSNFSDGNKIEMQIQFGRERESKNIKRLFS